MMTTLYKRLKNLNHCDTVWLAEQVPTELPAQQHFTGSMADFSGIYLVDANTLSRLYQYSSVYHHTVQ